jgi:NADH dehydrogenase
LQSRQIMVHRILIVGGGFGGVKLAQVLSKMKLPEVHIRLVDPKSYMEYRAATYRFVTGRSPMESCLLYSDLFRFRGLEMELVKDAIATVDLGKREAWGESGSSYEFDTLVLAVGGQTATFGIPGVDKYAYDIGTFDGAIRLKNHIDAVCSDAKWANAEERAPLLHIVVVGGGATGVELAGELGWYVRTVAKEHGADPAFTQVDIVETMQRVLPTLAEPLSAIVEERLRSLGVRLLLGSTVKREEADMLILGDREMKARTVVWTAGLKANKLLAKIPGLTLDKKGRAVVNDHLEAAPNIFAIGDAASTKYSGMAQTALADAEHVARMIRARITHSPVPRYTQPPPAYAIPVGPKWALVLYHGTTFHGLPGWMLRRAADFRAFLTLLPPLKAFSAFWSGTRTMEVPQSHKKNQ